MRPCPPPHPAPSRPAYRLPAGACDAHCHVFGPAARFPYSDERAYTPLDMPKETLFALHEHLGITRRVVVQASCHGTDNRALMDALLARPDTSRGVAVLAGDISDAELAEMHAAGVRGARFNFMARIQRPPRAADIESVIRRIAPLGWHVVLHFDANELPTLSAWIKTLEIDVLVDHCARLRADDFGGSHFESFCRLMERPNVWTKLSAAERGSASPSPYSDMIPTLRAIAEIAPSRVLWGTDWPHPVLGKSMPDDGLLVDNIVRIISDAAQRQALLVDNPSRLYEF